MDSRHWFTLLLAVLPAIAYSLAVRKIKVSEQSLRSGYICGCVVLAAGIWWMMRISVLEDAASLGCPIAIAASGLLVALSSSSRMDGKEKRQDRGK